MATVTSNSVVALVVALIAVAGTILTAILAFIEQRSANQRQESADQRQQSADRLIVELQGKQAMYGDRSGRNAAFQMAKREVYAEFLAATRTHLDIEFDDEDNRAAIDLAKAQYRKEYARVMMYGSEGLCETVKSNIIEADSLPSRDMKWDDLTTALHADVFKP